MACPKCGGSCYQTSATMSEKSDTLRTLSSMRGGHPAAGLIPMVVAGAKEYLSKAYRCTKCGHEWREWFK